MHPTWKPLSLSVATRACMAGWLWGKDPRRPQQPCFISPRGTCFEVVFRFGHAYRRRYQDLQLNLSDR